MEHIKILDELLIFLSKTNENQFPYIKNELEKESDFLKNIENSLLHAALLKLVKDGYVNEESEEYTDPLFKTPKINYFYKISFEGLVFMNHGGYENLIRKNQTLENLRNEMTERQNALEEKQVRFQGQIVFLTWAIALGTLIAAVYYFLEILKFYGTCSCE
ncbi:hypothetical protein [Maribacter spongiicola]|uniref:hypothetical protein n=1 Tax=Maribacter spongiicola TaxID=1206753 RepID=UPI003F9619DF